MHHLYVSNMKILLHSNAKSLSAVVMSSFSQHYSAILLRGLLKLHPNLNPRVIVLVVIG